LVLNSNLPLNPLPGPTSLQTYQRLLRYVRPYSGVFTVAVIGMFVVAGGETAFAWLMKPLMDQGFVDRDASALLLLPFQLIGILAVRAVGQFFDSYALDWVGRQIIFDLRQSLFKRMIHLPTAYYDQASSASLVSKLVYDAEQVSNASTVALRILIRDSIHSLMLIGLMLYLSWKMTLAFLIVVPLAMVILRMSSSRLRKTSTRIQETMGQITHAAKEALQGHSLVKAFNAFEQEQSRFGRVNNRNRQQYMKRSLVTALSVPLTIFIAGLGLATIIAYALSLSGDDQLTAGTFVAYLTATVMLMQPIRRLAKINETIQTGIAAAESLFVVIDESDEPDTGTQTLKQPVTGRVEFKDLSFTYPGADAPSLRGINFEVKPRTKVALVGISGSGKSTAIKLLGRLYQGYSGSIAIDGQNVQELRLANLREQIAVVPQKPMLFDDSIKNNIVYGSDAYDAARFESVVQAAQLNEFVSALPEAYETQVGENGARLSGGQQQRVAIARALYKDAPILLLDEATSALDSRSEKKIQIAIDALLANRTALIVAHRLSTIQNADWILVFDQGRIVEQGTHTALLKNKAAYYQLYQAQKNQSEVEQVANPVTGQ